MYSVKKDLTKNRVNLKLSGWITIEEAQNYAAEVRAAVDSFFSQKVGFKVLADLTEYKTTSKDVAEVLSTVQDYAREKGMVRSAVVVPAEAVGAMQVKRYAKISEIDKIQQYFATLEEAEEYLA